MIIKLIISLIFSNYAIAIEQTCEAKDEQYLVKEYNKLIPEISKTLSLFNGQPKQIDKEENFSRPTPYYIIANNQELLKKVEYFNSIINCTYSIEKLFKNANIITLDSKCEKNIDCFNEYISKTMKLVFSNKMIYLSLFCKNNDSDLDLIIHRPVSIIEKNCANDVPDFTSVSNLNPKQKDILIEKICKIEIPYKFNCTIKNISTFKINNADIKIQKLILIKNFILNL